jgi:hypothetical protein
MTDVTGLEEVLLRRVYSGKACVFEGKPVIDAAFVCKHILGLDAAQTGAGSPCAIRWEIQNAIFAGEFNLCDGCRCGGGFLPALEFVNCEFQSGFWADGAKIERLRFKDCLFTAPETATMVGSAALNAPVVTAATTHPSPSGSTKNIEATIAAAHPSVRHEPPVTAPDAAQLEAKNSEFRNAENESEVWNRTNSVSAQSHPRWEPRNRISLRNCRIATELRLEGLQPCDLQPRPHIPELRSRGPDRRHDHSEPKPGMLILDAFAATIGTNVIVRNTTLRAPQGESSATLPEPHFALDLSTSDIGSDLQLMPGVVLEGGLKMRDAHIGGSLWAHGLKVTDGENHLSRAAITQKRNIPRAGLRLETTHIEGNVMLDIDASQLQRTADLLLAEFRQRLASKEAGAAVKAAGEATGVPPTVEQEVVSDEERLLTPAAFRSVGDASLLNSTIDGDLYFSPGTVVGNLNLANLTIRGAFRVSQPDLNGMIYLNIEPSALRPLKVQGTVWLNNCNLGGDCTLIIGAEEVVLNGGVLAANASIWGDIWSFWAQGAKVTGDLLIACTEMIRCDISGAKIGGTMNFTGAGFKPYQPPARAVYLGDELTCYPSYHVDEVLLPVPGRNPPEGIASFLVTSRNPEKAIAYEPILLNGSSDPFHKFNRGEFTVIDPNGSKRLLRGKSPLVLDGEDKAREYLKLFCAFVWAERGSFGLLTEPGDLPNGMQYSPELLKIPVSRAATGWESVAYVRYGDLVYKAAFQLAMNGVVQMTGDDPAWQYDWTDSEKLSTFNAPFRIPSAQAVSNRASYRSDFHGRHPLSELPNDITKFDSEASNWQSLLNRRPEVRLTNASCSMLNDSDAKVWKSAGKVELEEFDYRTIKVTRGVLFKSELENRLGWVRSGAAPQESAWTAFRYFLGTVAFMALLLLSSFWLSLNWPQSQANSSGKGEYFGLRFCLYLAGLVLVSLAGLWLRFRWEMLRMATERATDFNAQPFAHLAAVFRQRGDDNLARKVEAEKMWQEAVQRARYSFRGALAKILWWRPYGVMFEFGLAPSRALASVLAIWVLGWGAVSTLSRNDMLQANVTRVGPAALVEKGPPVMIVPAGTQGVPPISIACGDAIEPGLYSFELLTPILNLHQESRCEIRSKPAGLPTLRAFNRDWRVPEMFTHAVVWEYGKALYMLAGSIIISLALLTFSGIARRWEH